jgi:cytochrome b561
MWKSSPERYGRFAIVIHWTSALLIVCLMIAGFLAAGMTDPVAKASILRIHAPIGAAILVLTLARLCWWQFWDTKPKSPAGVPPLQSVAAKAVHSLLYVAVFGLAGSGIAMIAMSGAGEILFGDASGPLPDFWNFPPRYGHAVLARVIVALLFLHIGAAVYHQFIRKDRLFARMGVGR